MPIPVTQTGLRSPKLHTSEIGGKLLPDQPAAEADGYAVAGLPHQPAGMASNLTGVGITARDMCQHSDGPRQYSAVLSSGIDCFDLQKSHFSSPPIPPVVDTNHLNQQNQVTYMMCTGHLLYCTKHLCSPHRCWCCRLVSVSARAASDSVPSALASIGLSATVLGCLCDLPHKCAP